MTVQDGPGDWGDKFWHSDEAVPHPRGVFPLSDAKALQERYLKILDTTPLFRSLPRRRRHAIAKAAEVNQFRHGEVIEREGEVQQAFHVILDGSVYVRPRAGHDRVLWSQSYFGDVALLDGAPRTVTLIAAGPVTTASITKEQFEQILHEEPAAAAQLLPGLVLVIRDLLAADAERLPDHSRADEWCGLGAPRRDSVAKVLSGPDAQEWLPLLRGVKIFSGLDDKQLRHIAGLFTIERFSDGDAVTIVGDPGDSFHVILKGQARVCTAGGHLRELGDDDCFGELALIDASVRSATVTAVGELVTGMLTRSQFQKMLKQEPRVAFGLATGLVGVIRDLEGSFDSRE